MTMAEDNPFDISLNIINSPVNLDDVRKVGVLVLYIAFL
jgi:hypothetical protein